MAELLGLYDPLKEALTKHLESNDETDVERDELFEFLDDQQAAFQELIEAQQNKGDDETDLDDKEEFEHIKSFLDDLNLSVNSFKKDKSNAGDVKDIFDKTLKFFEEEEAEYEASRVEEEEYEKVIADLGGPSAAQIDKMYFTLVRLFPAPEKEYLWLSDPAALAEAVDHVRDRINETLESEGCQDVIKIEAQQRKGLKMHSTVNATLTRASTNQSLGIKFKSTSKITVEGWSSQPRLVVETLTKNPDGTPGLAEASGIRVGDMLQTYDYRFFTTEEEFKKHVSTRTEVTLLLIRPVEINEYDIEVARRLLLKQVLEQRILVAQTTSLWLQRMKKLDFEGAIILLQRIWKKVEHPVDPSVLLCVQALSISLFGYCCVCSCCCVYTCVYVYVCLA